MEAAYIILLFYITYNIILKIRDIHKIEKKISISISVFGYLNKENHPIYVSKKCCEKKHVDFFLYIYI